MQSAAKRRNWKRVCLHKHVRVGDFLSYTTYVVSRSGATFTAGERRKKLPVRPRVHENKNQNRYPTFYLEPQTAGGIIQTSKKLKKKKHAGKNTCDKNPSPLRIRTCIVLKILTFLNKYNNIVLGEHTCSSTDHARVF